MKMASLGRSIGIGLSLILLGCLAVALPVHWESESAPELSGGFPTAIVERRDFIVGVDLIGTLDAASAVMITAAVGGDRGKIIDIIRDGAEVEIGDVLVRLDPTPFEERVAELEAELAEKRAKVEAAIQSFQWEKTQIERELRDADFEVQLAQFDLEKLRKGEGPLELARLERALLEAESTYNNRQNYADDLSRLVEQNYVDQAEAELARQNAEEALNSFEIARAQLATFRDFVLPSNIKRAEVRLAQSEQKLTQGRRAKDYRLAIAEAAQTQAKASVANLEGKLKSALADLKNSVIRAPKPGMVVLREGFHDNQKRKPRVGDVVLQRQPLLYLPDISKMIVETHIREIDLHKIDNNSEVEVEVDAYPELRLVGRVSSIGALAETSDRSEDLQKYFRLNVTLDQPDIRLRPGMTARLRIIGRSVHDAISVPVAAIFTADEQEFVYLERDGEILRQGVEIGDENDFWAEIRAGVLRVGDIVHLTEPEIISGVSARGSQAADYGRY